MTREMDLLREILLMAEKQPTDELLHDYSSLNRSPSDVFQHVQFLKESGWVETTESHAMSGSFAMIVRITSRGHDVIEHIRDDAAWNMARAEMQLKVIPVTMENMIRMIGKITDRKFS